MRIHGSSTEFTVTSAVSRAGYLDLTLLGQQQVRVFLPDAGECRHLAKPGAVIRYEWDTALGVIEDTQTSRRCDVVGIGTLTEWRVTRPEDTGLPAGEPVPRELARYRVVFRDKDVIVARGTFPLTRHLGWVGSAEAVVMLHSTPGCLRGPAAVQVASLEYFPAGDRVLGLVSKDRWCDVEAVLLPLASAR